MSHLNAGQLEALQLELERQLERLVKSMAVTRAAAAPVELDQTSVGRLSRMDSLQNQGLTQNLKEREQVKLARIQESLARMEAGDYGLCRECGEPIPFERLFVFPEAPTCAGC